MFDGLPGDTPNSRVTLYVGHYGSGKTNLAVNAALSLRRAGRKTLIADLDIVNPYFRTRDSVSELSCAGVEIVVSDYANTNVDVPALPEDMYRVTQDKTYSAVVDVGGDDRGALALGRLAPALRAEGDYDMRFVVNFYRPLTRNARDAARVVYEVAKASGLECSGIVNNSNLGAQTTPESILETAERARELSELTGIPLIQTTAREDLCARLEGNIERVTPIKLYFKPGWAIW